MKKNRYTLILVIVLAIAAVALLVGNKKGTLRRELKDFAIQDTSNVTRIFMSDKAGHQVILTRKGPGSWEVNGRYKVRQDAVNILLKTMLNVDVREPVPKSAHNNVVARMAAMAVKVEIYQQVYRVNFFNLFRLFRHEKRSKTYYVGDNTQDNMGTFMLMEHSSEPFVTYLPGFRGFISIRYSPREEDWRDHTIFNEKTTEIESVTVDFRENPTASFTLSLSGGNGFRLAALHGGRVPEKMDSLKVASFLEAFGNIKYEALLNNIQEINRDSILRTPPFHVITLREKSGRTMVVKTFHKKAAYDQNTGGGTPSVYDLDRMFALVNDGQDFVLIQFFVFDRILKPVDWFAQSTALKPQP